jgi:hypothetical protein
MDLDHIDVFWEIGPVPGPKADEDRHEIFDYQFFLSRSEAMMGPYQPVAGPLRDQYWVRDIQVSLLHNWRDFFYKLLVLHVPTGETLQVGPTSFSQPAPDLIASEIMHQEDVLFREFIGRRCWLFPARTFGPRCSCFDVYSGRRTRSGHKMCFDTGFLGGFLSPVEVFVQIDPPGKSAQATALTELQPGDTSARMICFPPVNPKDILVESENVRWRVVRVSTTQRLRTTVHQELTIHQIPKGDVEYDLPVNVDLKNLSPSAARNFTNPSNVKNDADYSDIFDFWSGKTGGTLR